MKRTIIIVTMAILNSIFVILLKYFQIQILDKCIWNTNTKYMYCIWNTYLKYKNFKYSPTLQSIVSHPSNPSDFNNYFKIPGGYRSSHGLRFKAFCMLAALWNKLCKWMNERICNSCQIMKHPPPQFLDRKYYTLL